MYDHLHGEVVEKQTSRAVIRCGGVGYEVRISLTSAAGLKVGQTCQVFTILHVVDGTPSLLGFASRSERELARKLLGVGGVGPSIALSLLSVLPPADLARAVAGGAPPPAPGPRNPKGEVTTRPACGTRLTRRRGRLAGSDLGTCSTNTN
jgi:Holliday junction DNA helicase RuvA